MSQILSIALSARIRNARASKITFKLFRNSQLTVRLTVQIDAARKNVSSSGSSNCTVTVNTRQPSILEKQLHAD